MAGNDSGPEYPIVFLDEPTSALDIGHQVAVMEAIRKITRLGKTVLLGIHDLAAAARYGDYLIAMQNGQIKAQGDPRQVVTSALVHAFSNTEVDILAAPKDQAPGSRPAICDLILKSSIHCADSDYPQKPIDRKVLLCLNLPAGQISFPRSLSAETARRVLLELDYAQT